MYGEITPAEAERLADEYLEKTRPNWWRDSAKKIPDIVRKHVLQEGWIDSVQNMHEAGTPIEFLFSIYEEYIDITKENNDFSCGKCRQKVIDEWRKMKPYLQILENGKV